MLLIPLNSEISTPMYEQIYEYIKQDILHGNFAKNTKLPSSRILAEQLNVSRSTINSAYGQLLSEGYIYSKEKRGYYVSDVNRLQIFTHTEQLLKKDEDVFNLIKEKKQYTFSPFSIDTENFPYSIWRKLTNNVISYLNAEALSLGDSQGDDSFRQAIWEYLTGAREIHCSKEQIIVGAGTDYLLMLLCGLFPESYKIAMENPSYMRAYHVFSGLNRTVLPVPVTNTGMDISSLIKTDTSIAYVTPSHQYPLGVIMSVAKRHELLQWANQGERYIIEDDHDSEFRYKGLPIPSLQSMDTKEKVIYMGTFSRAIAPAIRVSYMVLPPSLMELYQKKFAHYSSTVSRVDQKILTDFIKQGYLERHLNKMRKIYHQKHDYMLKAFRCFGDKVSITGEHAGLHLVVTFRNGLSEEEIMHRAKSVGIYLYNIKEHEIVPLDYTEPTFLFGFAGLSEKEIAETISKLYQVLL